MKSFFQSFSFLRDKKSLQTTLAKKVDSGWLFPRFFVLALVSYLLLLLGALFVVFTHHIVSSYQQYDRSAENVASTVDMVARNVLSELPKNFSATFSSTGLSTNLQEPLVIHNWVLSSGTSLEQYYRKDKEIDSHDGLLMIDAINSEPDISLALLTLTKDSYIINENDKKKMKFYNERGALDEIQEPFTFTYTDIQNSLPLVNEWILANRNPIYTLGWVVIVLFLLFGALFTAVFISLFTILITYVWAIFTRIVAKVLNKGRDYDTSYNHTILAVFPLFVLNRFVSIPWFIDLLMIVVLVFAMHYMISSKNK